MLDLVKAGYDKDLAKEALYRANGNSSQARDYCKAHKAELAGPRNPIPIEDADTSALDETRRPSTEGEMAAGGSTSEADRMSLDGPPELSPADIAQRFFAGINDESSQTTDDTGETPSANHETLPGTSGAPANTAEDPSEPREENQSILTKADLDKHRSNLRENMIDRSLDIIRAHPDSAIEISELIQVMVLGPSQNSDAQEEVGSTLTFALSSLALDDEEKKRNGKCIAAYAHLLALLLQDEGFFESNIDTLRDKVEEYVGFLKTPPFASTDEMPPWIPYILLVVEGLLCHDEKPVAAQWTPPKSLEDTITDPVVEMRTPLIDEHSRTEILDSLLEFLPRIGKEETLAVSALRVLVILTRDRNLAKQVGEKKNLQRLFLMAKQLSGSGSERLRQTKLTAHILTVLRHIVEDEDIIRQVMRAEIKSSFPSFQRNQRGNADVASYLRIMAPIALRAPDLFVEVTNELLRFSRWVTPSDGARTQQLALREQTDDHNPEKTETVKQTSEDSTASDIKPSTEQMDKEMSDVPKTPHESKRPIVENPDGVIHFLLCELVNYREVDDKEAVVPGKDVKPDAEPVSESQASSSKDNNATDGKDKKPQKPVFKAEEHPIFVYRCFLLNCLTELLQSYNRTKVEFINFKRSAPPLTTNTPIKPRSSVLNYLIYDLLCQGNLSGTTDTIASKKRAATSAQTEKVLVALVAKTSEKAVDRSKDKFAYDEEPDLLFVRRFVLDTMLKAYERAPVSDEPLEVRYSRMQCLAELMNNMVGERDKEQGSGSRGSDSSQARSQAQLRRLMYEKGYLDKLTSSIADINLNYPGVKRAIKYILRVLRVLTDTAKELSHSNILPPDSVSDHTDDDLGSTSSLSDLDDDREETPDLYRNSALGMLEPRGEYDESDEDEEDDDEDMYGDDYDDEEMDYGEDDISDVQDNISDDDDLSDMGEIEGLPGQQGVVEVIMGEDDEDDDSEDDDEDDDDDDDDDDIDSADMEDIEDQVEIVDEDGNPIDDDGNSGWESESHDEDDEDADEDELDYEGEVQDEDEAHIHGMGPGDLIDGMARAIMGGNDLYDPDLMDGLDDHYIDDGHDDDGKRAYSRSKSCS